MAKNNKVDPLAQLSTELADLREKMIAQRREGLTSYLQKLTIPELRELQEYWEEEIHSRNRLRLSSDFHALQYQEAKEIAELIGQTLQSYPATHIEPVTHGPDAVLSVKEAAEYLGVSESIVRGKIKRNEIPYVKIEGQYKFYMAKVREWLSSNSVQPNSEGDTTNHSEKITKGILNDILE